MAGRLMTGAPIPAYAETVLILCAAISALAADAWPGRNIDRRRFVEALKVFAPPEMKVDLVSVPLLVASLRSSGHVKEAICLADTFDRFQHSQILTSRDIDQPEATILALCPGLARETVRKHCYANLLYQELRSPYSHEYRSSSAATEHPMTATTDEPVSYVNQVGRLRQIHFHWQWLAGVAVALADGIDAIGVTLPLPHPQSWWIEG